MPQSSPNGQAPFIPQEKETTQLSPLEEVLFKAWMKKIGAKDLDAPDSFYDYRGYWKDNGPSHIRAGVDHFPDTYKQHGHPTFSNESKYSRGSWDGGRWIGDAYVPQLAHSEHPIDDGGRQMASSLQELMVQRAMGNEEAPYTPK